MDKETMSKQESVKEPVKRFDLEFADPYGFREGMALNKTEDGDYVFYSDYAALQQRLDAVSGALEQVRSVLKEILPPEGMEGWWCPNCRCEVNATFHEYCATCGTFIGNIQPSTEWMKKARAALASIGEGVV